MKECPKCNKVYDASWGVCIKCDTKLITLDDMKNKVISEEAAVGNQIIVKGSAKMATFKSYAWGAVITILVLVVLGVLTLSSEYGRATIGLAAESKNGTPALAALLLGAAVSAVYWIAWLLKKIWPFLALGIFIWWALGLIKDAIKSGVEEAFESYSGKEAIRRAVKEALKDRD